jgi:hypothetical protein
LLRFIQITLVSAHTHAAAAASLAAGGDSASASSAERVDIARALVGEPSLLAAVARTFAAAQGEAKFDALCLLARLLEVDEQQRDGRGSGSAFDVHGSDENDLVHGKDAGNVNSTVSKSEDDDDEWVFAVRLALRDVLFSRFGRAKAPYRCAVLKCCGAFLRRRRARLPSGGQQWAVRPWGTPEQSALFTSGQFVQVRLLHVPIQPSVLFILIHV